MTQKQDKLANLLDEEGLLLEISFDGSTGASRWKGVIYADEKELAKSSAAQLNSLVIALYDQLEKEING